MVIAKAYARYIRISPSKVQLVIDLIRGEKVNQALVILNNLNKKARVCVEKALTSALANAKRNPAVQVEQLYISKITADNGPMLKRYQAQAMGRATMIRHRTTHLSVELSQEITQAKEAKTKNQPVKRTVKKSFKVLRKKRTKER
ncbi:MAG: 50S ribosomal protein L22 [Candidatus Omnitrophica bacterium]|nr:50S ribosomal protein L22 [Candidatus Omnitrophota bacterium]